MAFREKTIEITSLGEKLRTVREEAKVSLEEFAERTRIQKKYLQALEAGEDPKLQAVYIRGILGHYATNFQVKLGELEMLWERERPTPSPSDRFPASPVKPPTVLFTPARLRAGWIVLVLLFFLWFFFLR